MIISIALTEMLCCLERHLSAFEINIFEEFASIVNVPCEVMFVVT